HRAARASGVRRPPRAAVHVLADPPPHGRRAAPARPRRARPRSVRGLGDRTRRAKASTKGRLLILAKILPAGVGLLLLTALTAGRWLHARQTRGRLRECEQLSEGQGKV